MICKKILKHLKGIPLFVSYGYIPPCKYSEKWLIKPTDKFLVLVPHPDDESIGCGGFLLQYARQCDVILLTNGCYGGKEAPERVVEIRLNEFTTVMNHLQVRRFECLNIEDSHLIAYYKIFNKIDITGYDYILMPGHMDMHPDHMAVSHLFKRLCKHHICLAKVVYYEIWSALAKPTHYIDISNYIDEKTALIRMYKSQDSIDYAERILALNHWRGITHYVEYEENFEIM
jgi:LmbE family N-acetylglucosaminyl deacetylase